MPAPEFRNLQLTLLAGGVAPRFVERTILELREHYADIELEALNDGLAASDASARARAMLGSEQAIAAAVCARPELMDFAHRWPLCARWLRALAFCAVLPAVPVLYCAQHGSSIARWSASVSLATIVTGAMLLALQQSLT